MTEFLYDAFLSHNSQEKDAVEAIAKRLESLPEKEGKKLKVWLDKWDLIPGRSSVDGIEKAITQSRVFVLFLGPAGLGPWHELERRAAIGRERDSRGEAVIIPVLLPGVEKPKDAVPLLQRDTTWVTFKSVGPKPEDIDQVALQLLACGIRGESPREYFLQTRPQSQSEDNNEPIVPRGLRSFSAEDSKSFLRLLPGPFENGLPASISFWKQKIEELDPDKTFRVGLLKDEERSVRSDAVASLGNLGRATRTSLRRWSRCSRIKTEACGRRLPKPSAS